MKKPNYLPKHLAIIPDGNRRWAKSHGINVEEKIYEQGSQKTFEIIKAVFEANVPCVTFWASSYANLLSRPKMLVAAIEKVYEREFRKLAEHPLIHQNKVKIQVYGEWLDILKPNTVKAINAAIVATEHYTERYLTILVGYDGVHERGAALTSILQSLSSESAETTFLSSQKGLAETASVLRQHSWTGHLPDVDLVVRTGSHEDPHNSAGFLSMITGESQYSFPDVLWPEFSADMLQDIIADFAKRERRHGR